MTTESIFCVAGPFADIAGERLEPTTEYILVDKVTKEDAVLPAGNIVTELAIRRRGNEDDPDTDLTPGRGVAVGIEGDARLFLETPGAITDELNNYVAPPPPDPCTGLPTGPIPEPYIFVAKVDPSSNMLHTLMSNHEAKKLVLQSAFGGNITEGGITVIIKYKPFSESIAKRHG